MGAAIGFITSEPMPLAQRIGMRLARTAQTVITFGRSRYLFSTQLLNRRSAPCQLAVNAVGPVRPDWRRLSQFGGCPKDVAMMRGKQSCFLSPVSPAAYHRTEETRTNTCTGSLSLSNNATPGSARKSRLPVESTSLISASRNFGSRQHCWTD